jgi:hypothetical protein
MKLHRRPAHAGFSVPVDPAGSPVCRGWCSGKVRANRIAEEIESRKTNPTRAHLDCHKPCCGIALNSFGASVGFEKRSHRSQPLPARDRGLYRDRPEGSQETSGSQARQQKRQISEIKANGSQGNLSATVTHAKGLRRIRKSIDHKASVCRGIRRLQGQGPDREPSTWRILM